MARGKAERLTVRQDGVEVTALRVHAECLLPENDVKTLKQYALTRGETYAAFTASMLQAAVNAAMEKARSAAAARDAERDRAASALPALEAALRRDRELLKELEAKLAATRRQAGGVRLPLGDEDAVAARWQ